MTNALFVFTLVASLVVLANGAAFSKSYCKMKNCLKNQHTVCKYPELLKTAKECGAVKSSGLSEKEKKKVLDAHNEYRALVASGEETRGNPGPQPAATNLKALEWDDELALIAQAWANQCHFGHDKCRNVNRFKVGQNVAASRTTGDQYSPPSKLVTQWYNEVDKFDKNQVKSVTNFKGVGHYTQMMWADTTHVGCGAVRYIPEDKWTWTYLVCNYGPAGNMKGGEVYRIR